MRHRRIPRHLCAPWSVGVRVLVLALVPGLVLLVGRGRTAAGWAFFGNPVQDLRQALVRPIHDTGKNSEELAARKRNLWHCIAGLRNLKELRDALLLREWRDMDLDESLAEIDRFARGQVAHRFEGVLHDVLQYGDSSSR